MRPLFAFLLVAVAPLTAAPVPKDFKKPDDKALIVGTWKPTDRNGCWFRFAADGTLETWYPLTGSSPMKWMWTDLDSKATPKRVTLIRVSDRQVYICPYELTGNTLRFAFYDAKTLPSADPAQWTGDVRQLARDGSK